MYGETPGAVPADALTPEVWDYIFLGGCARGFFWVWGGGFWQWLLWCMLRCVLYTC
jgi:hypothetical protein